MIDYTFTSSSSSFFKPFYYSLFIENLLIEKDYKTISEESESNDLKGYLSASNDYK
jgi:hypothetical protein